MAGTEVQAAPPEERPDGVLADVGHHDDVSPGMDEVAAKERAQNWRATAGWACIITIWYLVLQSNLRLAVKHDPQAREDLLSTVPLQLYNYSEAAFFVATILNLLNLIFEDTPEKQQLALLSVVIKALSWHCDHLIVNGHAVIKRDAWGALLLPSRYVQWSCSTPTMIFTISRISDLSAGEVAVTMAADWLMVVTGYIAAETPPLVAWIPLAACFMCFTFVLRQLWRMVHSALNEADAPHTRACLHFTLGSTLVVWNLFWIGWMVARMPASTGLQPWGEMITMFCNFAAKVVFSTSIMYNNYVTIGERRRAVARAREHRERIQAVKDLTVAVAHKDDFIAVISHELRTPLNAIIQLSRALSRGAGGPLLERGRAWLDTISSSALHLLGIVNDIILVQAGKTSSIPIRQELVDVAAVLDLALRTLLPGARREIVLEKMVHERLPPVVGDSRRLLQVVTSLVGNALKFTEKGRVTVKAYPDRGARHVVIKIVDTGCGIPRAKLNSIFNAFNQADMSVTRRHGGLGLGLAIARQLVGAHGGTISLHSEGPGRGTAAIVRIPVLQDQTRPDLEPAFRQVYEGLGYSTADLLDPETAAAEGRPCPAFIMPAAGMPGGPPRIGSVTDLLSSTHHGTSLVLGSGSNSGAATPSAGGMAVGGSALAGSLKRLSSTGRAATFLQDSFSSLTRHLGNVLTHNTASKGSLASGAPNSPSIRSSVPAKGSVAAALRGPAASLPPPATGYSAPLSPALRSLTPASSMAEPGGLGPARPSNAKSTRSSIDMLGPSPHVQTYRWSMDSNSSTMMGTPTAAGGNGNNGSSQLRPINVTHFAHGAGSMHPPSSGTASSDEQYYEDPRYSGTADAVLYGQGQGLGVGLSGRPGAGHSPYHGSLGADSGSGGAGMPGSESPTSVNNSGMANVLGGVANESGTMETEGEMAMMPSSAAGAHGGVPGFAVALMSSLYDAPDEGNPGAGYGGAGGMRPGGSGAAAQRQRMRASRPTGPARDSIEEEEMGEEDMEPPTKPPAASASNNVVNNSSSGSNIQANHPSAIAAMDSLRRIASAARQQQQQQQQQSQSQSQVMGGLGGNSMSGYSSANASTAAGHMGASIATAPQTEDVLAAAQLATMMAQHLPSPGSGAPVVPGGPSNNSSSNGSDRQGPARLTAEERAAMEAEAAVIRAQREWEDYCRNADDQGAYSRTDAPSVVADNLRLSQQYESALKAAQAANVPIKPEWQTWVARIPEHHRQALGSQGAGKQGY